jgi:3',5'-nucleoside bisphosphate phosphatase
MAAADLHVHTHASDGLVSPSGVVAAAAAKGLAAVAVTDHDTVDGLDEAVMAQAGLTLRVIPGIELSCDVLGREIHILGFFIDYTCPELTRLLKTIHESRFSRAVKMVDRLQKLGYAITLPAVLEQAGGAAPGRPHVARALVDAGYFANVRKVFDQLLGMGMPGYVERYKLLPQEAIAAIRNAGGLAAWAHPALAGSDHLLAGFIGYGLQGLEIYHPDHGPHQTEHYRRLAKRHGLVTTGGSDYHGGEAGRVGDLGGFGLNMDEYHHFLAFAQRREF